jgi:pyrroloquinoline-quinone synthase
MENKHAPMVTNWANAIISRIGMLDNPYFKTLQSGEMTQHQFLSSQEQFYFAVAFFSRPMSSLVARISDPKDRLDILHNILEEHGELAEEEFHVTTFAKFLESVGSSTVLNTLTLTPQVRAFNGALASACTLDKVEVGVACIGIIELAFADISALIGKAVVERGWVSYENLVHYKLHAEIDKRHAEELFFVVERHWHDENKQASIKQGLELGAYIFNRFYRDLHDLECTSS